MAKKKKRVVNDLDGTVEGLALEHFEREKAVYEERTGETVRFVPPVPVTRTPIKAETGEEAGAGGREPAEAGTPNETEGEGIE